MISPVLSESQVLVLVLELVRKCVVELAVLVRELEREVLVMILVVLVVLMVLLVLALVLLVLLVLLVWVWVMLLLVGRHPWSLLPRPTVPANHHNRTRATVRS